MPTSEPVETICHNDLVTRLWRSRAAVSITVLFSSSATCTYAAFAWLPEILGDVPGSTPTKAGVLLAVTGLVRIPGALVTPLLVARLRNVGWVIAIGIASLVLDYLGFLLAPTSLTLLWVLLIGSGSILFPVSLVLISSRTRTHAGTVALSGSAQGVAYGLGALGPLIVALLHDATSGWTLPLLFLLTVALVATLPAPTWPDPRSSRTSSRASAIASHRGSS